MLQRCLSEVRASSTAKLVARTDRPFESPCYQSDVSALRGITIAQLDASLNTSAAWRGAHVCGSETPVSYECRWAFYKFPPNIVTGGGPELQCVSDDTLTCREVRWVRTQ